MIEGIALATLITTCAPEVHPATMAAVINVESKGDHLALNVNRVTRQPEKAHTIGEAAATARRYIAQGRSVDLGLAQINSKNLAGLGLTIEQVLEPCTNLGAAQTILASAYRQAASTRGTGQAALLAALSAYNTGSFTKGFLNGYVAKYDQGPVRHIPEPPPVSSYLAQLEDAT